ncbi:uncharacterized protein LOC111706723 [Eurytemora carolleeae]|uniref:uncharacterized protein LOC111706723 n=1 Tax=Eurytemora carolleeae TaxID=1294199 RepID=UPI000C76E0CC|nr:uncharacterized protein LOC111706723 [Eurytemora carolleeae]|eukprot:XP_023335421.1 uncharacterized protein LOC111706723 [Eurytemora affinis]
MIETAIKGGGELVTTLKRSVSLGDLTEESEQKDQAPSLEKRRREIMTKSWHEDYQEGPRRVRQKKEGKEEMKGREGSVKKYKQPSSELRNSGRVGKIEYQEDEGSVSCTDLAYATLPRTSKRIRN